MTGVITGDKGLNVYNVEFKFDIGNKVQIDDTRNARVCALYVTESKSLEYRCEWFDDHGAMKSQWVDERRLKATE